MNNTLWFITHSENGPGDPDGFYCKKCFKNQIDSKILYMKNLVSMTLPENSPNYTCDICNKDYRD